MCCAANCAVPLALWTLHCSDVTKIKVSFQGCGKVLQHELGCCWRCSVNHFTCMSFIVVVSGENIFGLQRDFVLQ